tara:strand:- start:1912 stop:2400 length:489 start_codon:yes stop_codon:yes gene_type:complete
MTDEEKEAYFQALGESFAELNPFSFDNFDVTVGPMEDFHGRFEVATWTVEDDTTEEFGTVYLDTYEGVSREDLIMMIQTDTFVHELAHAAQYRTHEYEDNREQDHDAEFGLKWAEVYNAVVTSERTWSAEEAFEYLGVTADKRESMVNKLAAALEGDTDGEE